MLEHDANLNEFLRGGLRRVAADIPDERLGERAPGGGHPPIWVLGHLAICGEMALMYFGAELAHPRWTPLFGPGSSDEVKHVERYSKEEFLTEIDASYGRLASAVREAPAGSLAQPHGVKLLEGTPIATAADAVAHLLSSHFGFHLAQLSAWRRAAGHGPLF